MRFSVILVSRFQDQKLQIGLDPFHLLSQPRKPDGRQDGSDHRDCEQDYIFQLGLNSPQIEHFQDFVIVVLSAQKSKQSSQKSKLASGPFAFLSGTFTFLSGQFTFLIRTRAKVTPYLSLQPIYGFLEFGCLECSGHPRNRISAMPIFKRNTFIHSNLPSFL